MSVKNPYLLALLLLLTWAMLALGAFLWVDTFEQDAEFPTPQHEDVRWVLRVGLALGVIWLAVGALTHGRSSRDAKDEVTDETDGSGTGTPPGLEPGTH